MWKEFVSNLTNDSKYLLPVKEDEIHKAEQILNVKFSEELKSLLLETNGIKSEFQVDLIWSLDRILNDNIQFRNYRDFKELYMPFDCLLFFADAGNGDQFAYTIIDGKIRRNDVFVWNHENDSRIWVASSLKQYIEWWLNGTIKL